MRSPRPAGCAANVRARAASLMDDWASLAHERNADGTAFGYAVEPGISRTLLREMLEQGLSSPVHASAVSGRCVCCATSNLPCCCARSRRTTPRSTGTTHEGVPPAEPSPDNLRAG